MKYFRIKIQRDILKSLFVSKIFKEVDKVWTKNAFLFPLSLHDVLHLYTLLYLTFLQKLETNVGYFSYKRRKSAIFSEPCPGFSLL